MQAFPIRHSWMGLASIFLIALTVRSLIFYTYLGHDNNYLLDDSADYHESAQQIAAGNGFSYLNGKTLFHRVPGYSLFLALLYSFKFSVIQALWMQIILASFIPLLMYLLALILYPGNMVLAYAAALYSSFHLGLILYSNFLMSETLFIILLLLFFILFFKNLHFYWCAQGTIVKPSMKYFFLVGIVLGCVSLVRAVGPFLMAVSTLLLLLSRSQCIERLQMAVTLFAGWLLFMIPWLVRNYLLLGAFFFHTLPGVHFLYLSAARVVMRVHDLTYQEARIFLEKEVDQLTYHAEKEKRIKLNDIEQCRLMERLALHYFTSYPWFTFKTWLTDIMRTALSLFSAELLYIDKGRQGIDYFKKDRTLFSLFARYLFPDCSNRLLKIIILLEIIITAFILLGFFFESYFVLSGMRSGVSHVCPWFFAVLYIAMFIVIALAAGYSRLRLPAEPLIFITALKFWTGFSQTAKFGQLWRKLFRYLPA